MDAPARTPPASNEQDRAPVMAGMIGGLVGATCCVGPAIGVAMGAGSGSILIAMGRYRPLLFVIGGLVAFAIAAVLYRRRRSTCSTPESAKRLRSRTLDLALIAFAVTYGIGRFGLTKLIESFAS